ncbi:WRKY Transcription Factor [Asimina triloba]
MEQLVFMLSHPNKGSIDCREIIDSTVSKFKKATLSFAEADHSSADSRAHAAHAHNHNAASSNHDCQNRISGRGVLPVEPRTGRIPVIDFNLTKRLNRFQPNQSHQRFNQSSGYDNIASNPAAKLDPGFREAEPESDERHRDFPDTVRCGALSISSPTSSANSSFMSSITDDGSVSNEKQGSLLLLAPAPTVFTKKPPLSSSYGKKCRQHGHDDDVSGKFSVSRSSRFAVYGDLQQCFLLVEPNPDPVQTRGLRVQHWVGVKAYSILFF